MVARGFGGFRLDEVVAIFEFLRQTVLVTGGPPRPPVDEE
jgi:hypothetical protein